MSPVAAIVLTIVLLGLNAVFVSAEFALISARRTQLEPRVAAGSRSARMALRAIENITLVIAAAQLGITICSLGLGAVGEPAIAHLLEPVFDAVNLPEGVVHPISFILAMTIVVFAHVVLGEMVPKNLALVGPDRAALILGPFMLAVVAIFKPLVIVLNGAATLIVRALRVEPKAEVASTYSHDEVAGLVEESRREGLLDEHEYGLVSGALDFSDGTVDQVLLPLDGLVTIRPSATPVDVEQACAETGFSRFPVTDSGGDISGYLHIKDVLETDEASRHETIADKWVRPLATVVAGSGLYEALRTMQSRGSHMARVANEGGEVLGVIMLEDVLEELVGEIRSASS
ncbi:MAG: magnesium and cobalt exporter, family [Nocardioidaceae bacterium]|jgi:CBS domain containing-hemolysin-like protein|nr:magnesium and cobalt exporter, family [Nocardioidaceae bacterium]